MRKVYCIFLMIAFIFSGCKEADTPTTSELMEKYAAPQQELAEIWLYDSQSHDIDFSVDAILDVMEYYNFRADADKKLKLTVYTAKEMEYEQFRQKLQAAWITGEGPDLILTHDPNMVSDLNKLISAGALKSLDSMIAAWDEETYYSQVIEGVRSSDGQVYLLPISYDPDVIITTKETMKQYHLSEEHFSDFTQTGMTVLSLWEQLMDHEDILAEQAVIDYTRMIPSILQNPTSKTSLLTSEVQDIFLIWKNSYDLSVKHTGFQGIPKIDHILNGKMLLLISPISNIVHELSEMSSEQLEELVILPLRDTDGKMTGKIGYYALLPTRSKQEDVITDFLDMLLFSDEQTSLDSETYWLTQRCMEWKSWNYEPLYALCEEEMNLTMDNEIMNNFEQQIRLMIYREDSADWEELERSINIYLSE